MAYHRRDTHPVRTINCLECDDAFLITKAKKYPYCEWCVKRLTAKDVKLVTLREFEDNVKA